MDTALPFRHLLLALSVVAVWGTNFVVIKVGLEEFPPLFFAALRFLFAAIPGVFFIARPRVPLASLVAYGLLIGPGQFGLLFLAMRGDISPGLASLVIQMQVFFTIGLAIWLTGERVRSFQWVALLLAVSGIVVIGANTGSSGMTTPLGLGLVLIAAVSWGCSNMVAKQSGARDMLPYVVWASLFAVPPLMLLSLFTEGWPAIRESLVDADAAGWAAVAWQAIGNTLFGFAIWGWLLSRHPAALVTPMALLIPVFGMGSASLFLGEPMPIWKVAAAALVLSGLLLGVLYPRLRLAIGAR